MSNKRIYAATVVAIFLIVGAIVWGVKQPQKANAPAVTQENASQQNQSGEIIYFYGEECPHCKDVAKFLEDNKIADKVNFSKKEVWHDTANAAEMEKKAQECNIQKEGMGVPFVYAKGKCYVGTPQVEAFFSQEAGIQ
jgi:glutaredoxin